MMDWSYNLRTDLRGETAILSLISPENNRKLNDPGVYSPLEIPSSLEFFLRVRALGNTRVVVMDVNVADQIGPKWHHKRRDSVLPFAVAALIESYADEWNLISNDVMLLGEKEANGGHSYPIYRVTAAFRRRTGAS